MIGDLLYIDLTPAEQLPRQSSFLLSYQLGIHLVGKFLSSLVRRYRIGNMGLKNSLLQLLLVAAAPLSSAHPHGAEEKTTLHAAQPMYRRTLSHCDEKLSDPALIKRTVERRIAEVKRLRAERGLEER
jgi:hypothetical protein